MSEPTNPRPTGELGQALDDWLLARAEYAEAMAALKAAKARVLTLCGKVNETGVTKLEGEYVHTGPHGVTWKVTIKHVGTEQEELKAEEIEYL